MIRPLGKKVLLLKEKLPEKIGSIYLVTPNEANSNTPPHVGEVISLGPECTDQFKPGMRVSYHWCSGIDIEYEGTPYILISEENISGIIALNVVLS